MPRTTPQLAAIVSGLLMSPGARRLTGRHAGKIGLGLLAWRLWRSRDGQGQPPAGDRDPPAQPHPRRKWSGRRP